MIVYVLILSIFLHIDNVAAMEQAQPRIITMEKYSPVLRADYSYDELSAYPEAKLIALGKAFLENNTDNKNSIAECCCIKGSYCPCFCSLKELEEEYTRNCNLLKMDIAGPSRVGKKQLLIQDIISVAQTNTQLIKQRQFIASYVAKRSLGALVCCQCFLFIYVLSSRFYH